MPSVEDLFRRPLVEGDRPDQAVPSPDGRRVAFAWNGAGERSPRDLWLVPADGSAPPSNLTRFVDPTPAAPGSARPYRPKKGEEPRRIGVEGFDWAPDSSFLVLAAGGDLYRAGVDGDLVRLTDTEQSESAPRLAPDGRRVAFLAGGEVRLLALDRAAGPALVQLTPHEEGLVHAAVLWSPRGDRLAAVRRDERSRFDLVVPDWLGEKVSADRVRGGWYGEEVVVLSLAGGGPETLDLGPEAPYGINAVRFSPDGARLLVDGTSKDQKVRTLHLVEWGPAGRPEARLLDRERDERWVWSGDWLLARDSSTEFSPDGRRVLLLSERSGWAQPWLIDLGEAEPRARPIGAGSFETSWAAWASPATIVSIDNRSARHERRAWLVDVDGGRAKELGGLAGMTADALLSKDRSRLVATHSSFARPGELVAMTLPEGHPTRLTASVPERFSDWDWVVPEIVDLTAFDGTPIRALLWRPRSSPPPSRPAVVFVHGAGYMQDVLDGWTIYAPNFKFATRLAHLGYLVAEVDYRGSAGYGREFRTGVHKRLGGKDLDDVVRLARWLRDRHRAGRIGIYGGSYGGFLTLMALFRHGEDFDAGAALRFVADWENYARGNPWYCVERLGRIEDDPDAYRLSSPIHFAAGLADPLLLLHGMKDSNVHFQDAAQLTHRLIALGKRFELMAYPAEGHGWATPEGWIDGYRRIEELFERTLAGRRR